MFFKDKTALITGASSGIGAEFARQMHSRGASLILVARRRERLQQLAEELFSLNKDIKVDVIVADLTESSGLKQVEQHIAKSKVDILINNAGFGSCGEFDQLDLDHELRMIKLNISATLSVAHYAIKEMKKRRSGAIVSISSVAGLQPLPYMSTYSATKVFNLWHSLSLRQELSSYGIRVLTVCPGPTETEFFGAVKAGGSIAKMKRDKVEDVVEESIEALLKDKNYVVTGLRSKLMAYGAMLLPYSLTTWIMKRYFLHNMRNDSLNL